MNTNSVLYIINSVETVTDLMIANTVFLEYCLNYKIAPVELELLNDAYVKKKQRITMIENVYKKKIEKKIY